MIIVAIRNHGAMNGQSLTQVKIDGNSWDVDDRHCLDIYKGRTVVASFAEWVYVKGDE